MMVKQKKFYITTPIYYVNDKPHVGHAYTTIMADILARWHKLKGENVCFVTGLDENSQKTVDAAIKLGFSTTQKFTDFMAEEWIKAWRSLNIGYTDFIRTTEERHHKLVKEFINKVNKKGDIYKGNYSGLYCEGCEAFIQESELNKEGLCPLHLKAPKYIEEKNYFFKLKKYENELLKLIKENKEFIEPISRKNEILSFIKNGLRDISISRQSLVWGIPFPNDENHRVYVWFDALTNYLHPKKYWPADIQLMAKDIIKFHAIIWPAMLMSSGYKLPKKVFAHGFFTVNGQKMSKTLGNVIDPVYLANIYGVDALRYFYAREIPFGQDGDFSEESLKVRLNNELANELGNLVSRTFSLVEKKLDGKVSKVAVDKKLFKNLKVNKIDKFMLDLEPHNAIASIMSFVQDCNGYISEKAPWNLTKKNELNLVLYNLCDALRIIGILIQPFMPSTSEKIFKQLNLNNALKLSECKLGLLKNTLIEKGDILFSKVLTKEEKKIEQGFSKISCSVEPVVSKLGIKVKFAELINLSIKKKHMGLEKLKDKLEHDFKADYKILSGYDNIYEKIEKEGRCSVYNLIELVKKGGKLPNINTAVDSYNFISLKYSFVLGAHDREKVNGSMRFKILNGTEIFTPLFKKEIENIESGEFGVTDDEKVLCRMDIKQCDQTKVTEDTKNIILYVEGNENISESDLKNVIEETCELIVKFCGGEWRII